jgi:NAD(P)-dependent dehydrogenase (short-subunit alcohol dehydrogenase family)
MAVDTMPDNPPTAFVTGATRGIGREVAFLLARRGYRVHVCGASAGSVAACQAEARAENLPITVHRIDVRDADALGEGIARAAAGTGRLDVLVSNAGRPVLGNARTLTLSDWDSCLDINLRAHFVAAKAAIEPMRRAGGGAIVLISSIWALTAFADRTAYVTAKTATTGLCRALAVDHAGENIRVNCVAPGFVDTDLLRGSILRRTADVAGELARLAGQHPLGRLIEPADIAHAVAFLAGGEARNITGQTLVVDGGVTVRFAFPGS